MSDISYTLNTRERKALATMSLCYYKFEIIGKMPVGTITLARLVDRGFAEYGPSPRQPGAMGWAITDEGRRALYGNKGFEAWKALQPANGFGS
jgi:hypothetical protein